MDGKVRDTWPLYPPATTNIIVRIENSLPLENQAQEQNLNPEPKIPQAAGPVDPRTAHPRFLETKPPPQAEAPAKSQSQNTSTGQTTGMPKEEPLKLPNGGRGISSVNFINLKSSQVANQAQLPPETMGFRPNPVTSAKNQEDQVTNLEVPTNERTSS
ncbi:hypothetical protein DSO57_1006340 [Entomophthora muscae]|uniref:Uncharacterized protein n=1 Tax=Entomophthora muscae TaxID=34485 RepID=A0ACC2U5Q4_9FUNG|nr:hypothetical protein DSO57_1006340 [Entomophthora muscae]